MKGCKISLTLLSVAVLSAISANVTAATYKTINVTETSPEITVVSDEETAVAATGYLSFTSGATKSVAIFQTDKKLQLTGNNISISAPSILDNQGKETGGVGIYQAGANAVAEIGNSSSNVAISGSGPQGGTGIISNGGARTIIDGLSIAIAANGTDDSDALGIQSATGATVVLGSSNTKTIDININGNEDSIGLIALGEGEKNPNNGGSIIITAEEFNLTTNGGFGIHAQNSTQTAEAPEGTASVIINAERTTIKNTAEGGLGVSAFSNGYMEINGDLTVEATNAIDVRGNSTTNINQNGEGTVVLKGDVVFETPNAPGDAQNSGNIINAYVNINLSTPDSSWKGRSYQSYRVQNADGSYSPVDNVELNSDPYVGNVTGFEVNMSNGATWNVTGDSFINTANISDGATVVVSKDAKVLNSDKIDLSGGVLTLEGDATQQVNVNTLSGTGGTLNVATAVAEDGTFTTANLKIATVQSTETAPALTVNYNGITSDALTAENTKNLKALDIASGTASVNEYVQEGDINGAWTRQDGEGDGSFQANTKLTDFSSVNAMSLVQWRNEINHLTKRLGDIRASEGTIGAWARVYGGESQWGGANEVEMDHTTIQVGGDYRINNHWIAGAAFSYTDSRADLSNGDADGDSYSLAVYGTYTADGGSFLDVIGRYGYLKNDITAGNMALDTSSSAFSLSAEMGHTFRFINDAAYVEPQLEFTYGFISGDDATASNGVRIDQDDFQSFVTRVGVRAGYDFPQKKGSVYGMFSYSYDWMGDADGTASKDGLRQALSQDLGGGWVTYGVGAQIMLGDSAYFYGELERTSGGDIDNPYLFSAGVRMTF